MHRFFVSSESIADSSVRMTTAQAHQICHVLRMKAGDSVIVLDNLGWEYEVQLDAVDSREVSGMILDQRPAAGEPVASLTLYQSLLAREKFEWVLQKGTELGVCRFVPLMARRVSGAKRRFLRPEKAERWKRILREAAEQCERARIPLLAEPLPLEPALAEAAALDQCLVALPQRRGLSMRQALGSPPTDRHLSVGLFVGPEGGFDAEEVERCLAAGVRGVCLGPRVLRTETAALVGAALVLFQLGALE